MKGQIKVRDPFIVRYLSFYILAVSFASVAIPLGDSHLKYDWLGAIILCLAGAVAILSGQKINRKVIIYVSVYSLFLLLNSMVLEVTSDQLFNMEGFISSFFQFILAFCTFVVISNSKISSLRVMKLMRVWIVIACFAGMLVMMQVMTGQIIVDKYLFIPYFEDSSISMKVVSGMFAPTAWFSESSWLASFLVVPIIFLLHDAIEGRHSIWGKLRLYPALVILLGSIIYCYSLTGILSVGVGLFCSFVMGKKMRYTGVAVVCVCAFSLLALTKADIVILQIGRVLELLGNLASLNYGGESDGRLTSYYVRSVGFFAGVEEFLENPLSGIGVGQGDMPYHSGLITLIAEQGVIGTVLYFTPLLYLLGKLNVIRRQAGHLERHIAVLFIVALIADNVNGFVTHNSFHLQRWLLVSIAFGWLHYLTRADLYFLPKKDRVRIFE